MASVADLIREQLPAGASFQIDEVELTQHGGITVFYADGSEESFGLETLRVRASARLAPRAETINVEIVRS